MPGRTTEEIAGSSVSVHDDLVTMICARERARSREGAGGVGRSLHRSVSDSGATSMPHFHGKEDGGAVCLLKASEEGCGSRLNTESARLVRRSG